MHHRRGRALRHRYGRSMMSLHERLVPGWWYLERRDGGELLSRFGPYHSEAAAMGARREMVKNVRASRGVLTLPLYKARSNEKGGL